MNKQTDQVRTDWINRLVSFEIPEIQDVVRERLEASTSETELCQPYKYIICPIRDAYELSKNLK